MADNEEIKALEEKTEVTEAAETTEEAVENKPVEDKGSKKKKDDLSVLSDRDRTAQRAEEGK